MSYERIKEAIKRGWVEPITDEEQISLASKPGQPAPSLVTLPGSGIREVKDEGTVYLDKDYRKIEPDDDKASDKWKDDKDWKAPTADDTEFEKPSLVDSGELDIEEEAAKEDVGDDEIGMDTLVIKLPFIHGGAIKGLKDSGIVTIADLKGKTVDELIKIKGVGAYTAAELVNAYKEVVGD